MKALLYIIATLLIIIWVIIYQPTGFGHLLLVLAAGIVIFTIVFSKKLSNKGN